MCRFDQLNSARASVVHRRNEVGFLPARGSKVSTPEALHARGTFAEPSSTQARMLLYYVPVSAGRAQTTPLSADSTSPPKAIPERRRGASPLPLSLISTFGPGLIDAAWRDYYAAWPIDQQVCQVTPETIFVANNPTARMQISRCQVLRHHLALLRAPRLAVFSVLVGINRRIS